MSRMTGLRTTLLGSRFMRSFVFKGPAVLIGTIFAHCLVFLVPGMVPGQHEGAHHAPGSAWPVLIEGAVALALAMGVIVAIRAVRPETTTPRAGVLVRSLAAGQVALYLLISLAEAISAGASVTELLLGTHLWAGVTVQVIVAAGLAVAISAVFRNARTALRALSARHELRPKPTFEWSAALPLGRVSSAWRLAPAARGPPIF